MQARRDCGMSETVFQTTGLGNKSCIPQKHRTALKKPFDQVVWEGAQLTSGAALEVVPLSPSDPDPSPGSGKTVLVSLKAGGSCVC